MTGNDFMKIRPDITHAPKTLDMKTPEIDFFPTPSLFLTLAKKIQAAHCPGAIRLFSFTVLSMRKNPNNPLEGENILLLVRLVFLLSNSYFLLHFTSF